MGVDMSNNPPTSRTKDFFASPALSLSLAGIFREAGAAAAASANNEVEEGDEGSGGGGGGAEGGSSRREETLDISSENSGLGRSRSEDDFDGGDHDVDDDDDDGDGDGDKNKKKKRKKYHRHTAEQIRVMEAYVCPTPPLISNNLHEMLSLLKNKILKLKATKMTQDFCDPTLLNLLYFYNVFSIDGCKKNKDIRKGILSFYVFSF